MADKAIEVLLEEGRSFPPPKDFKKSAHVKSAEIFARARRNPEAFWAKAAKKSWEGLTFECSDTSLIAPAE